MKKNKLILSIFAAALLTIACDKVVDYPIPDHKDNKEEQTTPTPPEQEQQEEEDVDDPTVIKLEGAAMNSTSRWKGFDLGRPYVITKVSYTPQSGANVQLAVLEGANKSDFSDALPLAIIKEKSAAGQAHEIEITCSRAFQYVRYMSPANTQYNLTALEFWGWKGKGDDSQFYQVTNLPTVVINTQNAKEVTSKTTYISCNIFIISKDGKTLQTGLQSNIRGRGNASWGFPKKPYRIKFAEKRRILDSPSTDKSWTLINNYGDKTLMRNILAFEVSRRVGMAYTPFCQPVDVVMNGEYQGCYQLCDQVEVGSGRVPAKNGYFVEIDAYASGEQFYFYSGKGIPVTVKYPKDDEITDDQFTFIQDYWKKMETAMFSSGYKNESTGYRKYIDLDSFLQNFIVGEFCGNTDTYWSVNMYKDGADGVLYTGPVWDYDLAFDNDNRTYPINNLSDYIYARAGSVAADNVRKMVNRIVKDDANAKARLVEIWNQAKPALEDLNDYVDQTAALLEQSQQLNFKRWPILNQYVHQNPQVSGSYSGEVKVVKNYITGRLTRFDQLVKQ